MNARFRVAITVCLMAGSLPATAALSVNVGDGSCSDTLGAPYCSIQAAVDAAASGDSIEIAAGTYTNQHLTPYVVTIDKDLTLIGAGAEQTVIDGQDTFGGVSVKLLPVVHISNIGIKRGKALNVGGVYNGGGINNGGLLTLTNCAIRDSVANNSGGGVYSGTGASVTLTVESCVFENNQSKGNGGQANSYIYSYGGGAIFAMGALTVSGSVFNNNSAVETGGAIALFETNFTSSAHITGSSFSANTVTYSGGAIATQGDLTLLSSSVTSNSALVFASVGGGGGIYAERGGKVIIGNSTLSKNTASALFNHDADTTVFSSTFYQTSATNAGVAILNGASRQLKIKNSIMTHASIATSTLADCGGTITSLGYNRVTDTTGCTFNISSGDEVGTSANPHDAKLDALADNGGPTLTHALFSDSSAIDAGNLAGCTDDAGSVLSVDQRGQQRSSDDNNDGVARCNIGAYEGALAVASGTVSPSQPGGSSASSGASSGGGAVDITFVFALLVLARCRRASLLRPWGNRVTVSVVNVPCA